MTKGRGGGFSIPRCVERAFGYAPVMTGYVYMTASQKGGTIYIGVTNDLARRMPEHKSGTGSRFTGRYGVARLVWYEEQFDIRDAIQREKNLKRWRREWKIALIESVNPGWEELFRGTGW